MSRRCSLTGLWLYHRCEARGYGGAAYFDVEAIVKLESLPEKQHELEQVGELPHVPDAMQHGWLGWFLRIAGAELLQGALADCRHLWVLCFPGCDRWRDVVLRQVREVAGSGRELRRGGLEVRVRRGNCRQRCEISSRGFGRLEGLRQRWNTRQGTRLSLEAGCGLLEEDGVSNFEQA